MKRFFSILFIIVLCFCSVPVSVQGADSNTTQSYLYASKYTAAVNHFTDYKSYKYDTLQFATPGISNGTTGGGRIGAGFFTDYIPQGIAYSAHTNKIYMSAYSDSKQNTVIFVLSASGKYERTLEIAGYTGHAGGVACDDNYLYYVSGLNIYYTGLDEVKTALSGATNTVTVSWKRKTVNTALCGIKVGDKADSSNLFSSCSFCTYYNGLLWFGEFSLDYENSDYPYRASGESYFFGIDFSNKSAPVLKKVMTVPCQTQGAAFFKDTAGNTYLACSMSYGRKNSSELRFYKLNQGEWGSDSGEGGGTQIASGIGKFVHKNTNIKKLTMPNLMESVCTLKSGSKLYLLSVYESGANKYASSATYVMDRVSAIDIGACLSISTETGSSAAAHSFALTSEKAPSCTVAGSEKYTCTVCTATKTQTLPALGHDFSQTVESDETLAGVTDDIPRYYYSCTRCKAIHKNSENTFIHRQNVIFSEIDNTGRNKALKIELIKNGAVLSEKTVEKGQTAYFVFSAVAAGEYALKISGKALLPLRIENIGFGSSPAAKIPSRLIAAALADGDINADGVTDIADISAALQAGIYGKEEADNPADITGDGLVNLDDIATILLESNFAKTEQTADYQAI